MKSLIDYENTSVSLMGSPLAVEILSFNSKEPRVSSKDSEQIQTPNSLTYGFTLDINTKMFPEEYDSTWIQSLMEGMKEKDHQYYIAEVTTNGLWSNILEQINLSSECYQMSTNEFIKWYLKNYKI